MFSVEIKRTYVTQHQTLVIQMMLLLSHKRLHLHTVLLNILKRSRWGCSHLCVLCLAKFNTPPLLITTFIVLLLNLVIHITYIYSFIWFLQDSKSTLVANEETMAVYQGQFLFSREIVIVIVMVTTPEQKYLELASYLLFEGQRRIHWTVNSTTVKINY